MPKLVFNPVDRRPPPAGMAAYIKIFGMVMSVMILIGAITVLMSMAGEDDRQPWDWLYEDVKTNFVPIHSREEREKIQRDALNEAFGNIGLEAPDNTASPGDRDPESPDPVGPEDDETPSDAGSELGGVDGRVLRRERDREEAALLAELSLGPWLDVNVERADILDFEPFRDWRPDHSETVASERAANRGRQAPPYERLALSILQKLPKADDATWKAKVERGKWFFGDGREAVNGYRGRAFEIQGRLYDLRKITADPPVVLPDGSTVDEYYEGVVAFLREGRLKSEFPLEHQTALFQTLTLPDELKPFVDEDDNISHEDPLCRETVNIRLSGVHLRSWLYSREVAPFTHPARPVRSQVLAPLLLSADVVYAGADPFEITDPLLQQVRDSLRGDMGFVQDEAAYYAVLAQTARADDEIHTAEKIGFFDLVGQETGPRYRGQGIHVRGMVGDDYAPVILPPNISGLRRIFRAYVVNDLVDLNSPNRFLVDMIDPPEQLEPRAMVEFDARYYRNIFEAESSNATIRPLLVVRKLSPLGSAEEPLSWTWIAGGAGVVLVGFLGLALFLLSDRRERKRFEAASFQRIRERAEKKGTLKRAPGAPPAAEADKPPDQKPE